MTRSLRLALLALLVFTVSLAAQASASSVRRPLPRDASQNPQEQTGGVKKKSPPPGARGFEQFAGRDAADKLIKGAATRRSSIAAPLGGLMKRTEPAPDQAAIVEAERQHAAGNYEAAVAAYQKAIELRKSRNRNYDDVRLAVGKVYRDMERYEDALAEFQGVATPFPTTALEMAATYEVGNTYLDLGKYAEAINAYDQTLKILNNKLMTSDPSNAKQYLPSPHYNKGLAHIGLGQKEQAVSDFKKVIELKNDFPEAHFNLGLTLWQLGQADEARATETKLRALNAELAGKLAALFK